MVDILILGKDGQLGDAFVKIAQSKELNFAAYTKNELDITNSNAVARIINKLRPKFIINTSAYHVISECEEHPHIAFSINCTAVAMLAKVAKSINSILVSYSTNYIFDGKKKTPYLEQDRPNPLQMYGLSKLAGEIAVMNEYSEGAYIIRTSGVYGKGKFGSRSKKGNFILKVLLEAEKEGTVFASKKQITNPTYAPDLAESTLNLLEKKAATGIYHLANEGSVSWYDFARMILDYKKINSKVVARDDVDTNKPLYTVLENRNARKYGIVLPKIEESLFTYLKEI